jgi:tRNA(Ile)-lysidine synthetase-like protein
MIIIILLFVVIFIFLKLRTERKREELLSFWFSKKNQKVCFNSTKQNDIDITHKFGKLLQNTSFPNFHCLTPKKSLFYILLWDQIPRHVYRKEIKKIEKYLEMALKIVDFSLKKKFETKLSAIERLFFLLPLRHTRSLPNINRAINLIQILRKGSSLEDQKIYNRFMSASFKAIVKESDLKIFKEEKTEMKWSSVEKILDKNSVNHICNRNVISIPINNNIIIQIKNTLDKLNTMKVCVSLSGGVDSMVVLTSLWYIKRKHNEYKNLQILSVLIDYGNREETDIECGFLTHYTKSLGIPFYILHIPPYIRRKFFIKTKQRTLYEDVTRKVRFEIYRKFKCPILTGHNKDDCVENIITNILRGNSSENLTGMYQFGEEMSVQIVRPLISVSKKDILKYAKDYKIPFLYNSTVPTSTRGIIRTLIEKEGSNNISLEVFVKHSLGNFPQKLLSFLERNEKLLGFSDKDFRKYLSIDQKISIVDFISRLERFSFFLQEKYISLQEKVRKLCISSRKETLKTFVYGEKEIKYGELFWRLVIFKVYNYNKSFIKKPPKNKSITSFFSRLKKGFKGKFDFNNFFKVKMEKNRITLIC